MKVFTWGTVILLVLFFQANAFESRAKRLDLTTVVGVLDSSESKDLPLGWKYAPDMEAQKEKNYKGTNSQILSKRGGHVFLRRKKELIPKSMTTTGLNSSVSRGESYPVVYNPEQKKLGVVTRTLIVRYFKYKDLDSILQDYPIKLISVRNEISWAALKVSSDQDVFKIYKELKKDSRLKSITLEIISDRPILH